MKKQVIIRCLPLLVLISSTQFVCAFYDASIQRWINRDPVADLGFRDGAPLLKARAAAEVFEGSNLHLFVKNRPMNAMDAEGTRCTYLCTRTAMLCPLFLCALTEDSGCPPPGCAPVVIMEASGTSFHIFVSIELTCQGRFPSLPGSDA